MVSARGTQALSGWILGVLLWALSGDLRISVLGSLFGILVVWISGDPGWVLTGGVVSICVVALPVVIWSLTVGNYLIWGWIVVLGTSAVWLLLSIAIGRKQNSNFDTRLSIYLSLYGLVWIAFAARHEWSAVELLVRIGSMGEDNGTFLNNVALTGSGWGAALIPGSGDNGVVLGLFVTLGSTLGGLGSNQPSMALATGETLVRLYDTLGFLLSGLCVGLSLKRRKQSNILFDLSLCVAVGFGAAVFISGLLRAAHFSIFVIAVLAFSTLVLSERDDSESRVEVLQHSLALLPVVLLGQAWVPGVIVAACGVVIYCIANGRRLWIGFVCNGERQAFGSNTFPTEYKVGLILTLSAALGGVLLSIRTLYGTLSLSVLLHQFKSLMSLVGDDVRVPGWFAGVIILMSLSSLSRRWLSTSPASALILALSMSSLGLMFVGGFVEPFEPGYGPNKLLYLTSFILFPIAVVEVETRTAQRFKELTGVIVLCMTAGILNASTSPLSEFVNRVRPREPVEWAPGIARSLTTWPDKLTTCLSTRANGPPDDAWRCSRLLMGMQGMNYPVGPAARFAYNPVPNLIYRANMCAIASRQISDIAESEYRRLVLVLSDGSRRSTKSGCQEPGWAGPNLPPDSQWSSGVHSGIPWNRLQILSYEGNTVKP